MLNWGKERYVRLYTRNTSNWLMLPWQGKALWPLLLRAMDRDGRLDLGAHGGAGLASLVGLPLEVVEPGLAMLTAGADPMCVIEGTEIIVPNFVEAQEAVTTDALRKRRQREREKERASVTVTPDAGTVTGDGHASSRDVTSVPSRTVPIQVTMSAIDDAAGFDFESVYALYPRKLGKAKGMKQAKAQVKTPAQFSKLQAAVKNYAAQVSRDRTEPQFVKHFSSFMGCWEDYAGAPEDDATRALSALNASL